jgi:multidrug resistance efflux pump
MGPRREEVVEQAERVRRAAEWRALAVSDLDRARQVYEQDLLRYDLEIKQYQTELEFQRVSLQNAERLYRLGALAGESRRVEQKRYAMLQAQLEQTNAQRRSRQAEGVRAAEAELARRDKELADTQAALKLLEAGTRPEEIEAETARLSRLNEELSYLQAQQSKLDVKSPVNGVVVTPRLQERLGQLTDKGGVVCMIEDIRRLSVEISVPEEDLAGVRPGQTIQLKARALPFDRFEATVDQIAPSANGVQGRTQSRVIVYCHVENEEGLLKSGMTGYARIQRGTQTLAKWTARQALKYIRTEFWW